MTAKMQYYKYIDHDEYSKSYGQPIGVARTHGQNWESWDVHNHVWFPNPDVMGEVYGILGGVTGYTECTEEEANSIIKKILPSL